MINDLDPTRQQKCAELARAMGFYIQSISERFKIWRLFDSKGNTVSECGVSSESEAWGDAPDYFTNHADCHAPVVSRPISVATLMPDIPAPLSFAETQQVGSPNLLQLFQAGRTPEDIIYSRRMVRDAKARIANSRRQQRFRRKNSNGDVTAMSQPSSSSSSSSASAVVATGSMERARKTAEGALRILEKQK